jgi:hypothetical protein
VINRDFIRTGNIRCWGQTLPVPLEAVEEVVVSPFLALALFLVSFLVLALTLVSPRVQVRVQVRVLVQFSFLVLVQVLALSPVLFSVPLFYAFLRGPILLSLGLLPKCGVVCRFLVSSLYLLSINNKIHVI